MPRLFLENGADYGEAISVLQKAIRRADEVVAMQWAIEFLPKFSNGLWERLTVISHEDIGIANPFAQVYVAHCWATFSRFWDKKPRKVGPAKLALANAILFMCRGEKTRLADHFQCAITQRRFQCNTMPEVPDYALDKHTARGKQLGRGWEHWRTEGCLLIGKSAKVLDPYEDAAHKLWLTMVDMPWEDTKDE